MKPRQACAPYVTSPPVFQTLTSRTLDRSDHVWHRKTDDEGKFAGFKCLLCGGVIGPGRLPPPYPTNEKEPDFMPERYELPLTDEEKIMAAPRSNGLQ